MTADLSESETTSDTEEQRSDVAEGGDETAEAGRRSRGAMSGKDPSELHVALAVPLRAVERNKRVAATVLAGGIAYKIALWFLPFGLIAGGALGLSDADSTEDAVEGGGIPSGVANAIGDTARSADSEAWWLLAAGVPLLLWAGHAGAKAVQLVHALVWDEPPPKPRPLQGSLAFTGMACAASAGRIAALRRAPRLAKVPKRASKQALPLTIGAAGWFWAYAPATCLLHTPNQPAPGTP